MTSDKKNDKQASIGENKLEKLFRSRFSGISANRQHISIINTCKYVNKLVTKAIKVSNNVTSQALQKVGKGTA